MAQTHQWNVNISSPQNVIGEIDSTSVFYTGPFQPNTLQTLASLKIKNIGTTNGTVYWRLYDYPGVAGPPPPGCEFGCGVQMLIAEGSVMLNAGQTSAPITIQHITPTHQQGQAFSWPLGIKVKGETETSWPEWGMGLQNIIFNNSNLVIGLTIIIGIIGTFLYLKKRG